METSRELRFQRRGDEPRNGSYYDGAGALDVEWYFPKSTKLSTHVMRYHLPPGAAEGEHLHQEGDPQSCSPNSSDEIYVVTLGEVVVSSGNSRTVLKAGDAVYAPHGVLHGVTNETSEPAELVLVFGPATGTSPGDESSNRI